MTKGCTAPVSGRYCRAVALPEHLADPDMRKAFGVVEMPSHVHWWEPFRPYDLDKPLDRRAVYRQVLTDGTPDDVRWYIEVPKLVAMWHDIILPSHVRSSNSIRNAHVPWAGSVTIRVSGEAESVQTLLWASTDSSPLAGLRIRQH